METLIEFSLALWFLYRLFRRGPSHHRFTFFDLIRAAWLPMAVWIILGETLLK